ncbi:MAG: 16S rRNA (cytosine(967)-C(5))-methyltransferase RsmB [Clostridia bacterium]|nr:16S rRNA (cytosine(967)-C(5))-methyltransferase RsmB [Clostridia bacterium]
MLPREKALLALYDVFYDGKYSNMAVKDALKGEDTAKDKNFIAQLIYGTVRYKLTIDYIIEKNSDIKLKKMSKFVLLILEMGVYQICYLDKVPQSAAVNESVKLANKYAFRSKGFINAVLRNVAKNKDIIDFPTDRIKYLSVKYSFTEDMVKKLSQFDFCEELLQSLNKEPKTTIRINTLKCKELENVENSPLYEYAGYVKGLNVADSMDYNDGKFTVQDVAAMMPTLALSPKENEVCVDVCAAPGGKTTHMAELMKNKGIIYAFDIHQHKVELINKNAKRMGIDIIKAELFDATEVYTPLLQKADKVLADVPCSGIGIISGKPDIKWNKEDVSKLPEIQLKILENASKYLKIGGELVYSTCTLFKEENECVVNEFIKNNQNFELQKIELPSPLMQENSGFITLYPNFSGTDGFFIAKIKRCR